MDAAAPESRPRAGTLPASLGGLRALLRLDVSGNLLAGTLPLAWAQLPALAYLNVSNNVLNGTLPQPWQAPLATLDVSYNALTGAPPGAGHSPLGACCARQMPPRHASAVALGVWQGGAAGAGPTASAPLLSPLATPARARRHAGQPGGQPDQPDAVLRRQQRVQWQLPGRHRPQPDPAQGADALQQQPRWCAAWAGARPVPACVAGSFVSYCWHACSSVPAWVAGLLLFLLICLQLGVCLGGSFSLFLLTCLQSAECLAQPVGQTCARWCAGPQGACPC